MIICFLTISPVRHNLRAMESYLYTSDDPAWKNYRLLYICLTDTRKPIAKGWKKAICIHQMILPTLIEIEYQSLMHILASSWAYWAAARGDLKINGGTWKSYFLPSDNIWATVLHPDHEENEEAIGEADAKQSVNEKAADAFLCMFRKSHHKKDHVNCEVVDLFI